MASRAAGTESSSIVEVRDADTVKMTVLAVPKTIPNSKLAVPAAMALLSVDDHIKLDFLSP
jgi:hypothetical protein